MTTTTITLPLVQPVTLAQIKQHLRIDHDDDDVYLQELADAATTHVEAHTGHSLINRTLRQYVDRLPADRCIELKAWPVSEMVSLTGYDIEGTPHVFEPQAYSLKRGSGSAVVLFNNQADLSKLANGLEMDFVAGHGDSGVDVPANIIRAMLVLIANWYELRSAVCDGGETGFVPPGLEALLAPLRRVRL